MVLLSALPCSDDLENKEFTKGTSTRVAHEQDDCNTESCSPICLCTCCGQSVVGPTFIAFEVKIPIIELENKNSNYPFSLGRIAQNIWQPPKLV